MAQAVGFVPASREDVKGDLSSDAISEVQVGKLLLHGLNHLLANTMLQIELFIVITFRTRTVSTDWRNVEHSASKLEERSTL